MKAIKIFRDSTHILFFLSITLNIVMLVFRQELEDIYDYLSILDKITFGIFTISLVIYLCLEKK